MANKTINNKQVYFVCRFWIYVLKEKVILIYGAKSASGFHANLVVVSQAKNVQIWYVKRKIELVLVKGNWLGVYNKPYFS